MIDALNNIPDVTFIDDFEVSDIQEQMIKDYQSKYEEITGKKVVLSKADPYRLILYACSMQQFQMLKFLDEMGKQNLLKYAESVFLDQIGALRGIKRLEGSNAVTTIRFRLAESREAVTPIAKGTRVASADYYFETTEYAEIPAGATYIDAPAECTELGESANDLMPGEVNTIVDSVAFIEKAENITTTSGGSDEESDDSFTDRIYLAPAGYSVAGPEDAYKYFVKEANTSITDVSVKSPYAGVVDIRFILEGGVLPEKDLIEEVKEYVSAKDKRPLTDKVEVAAPDTVDYELKVRYWLPEAKKSVATSVQSAVDNAINEYILWQNSKIGRDINPSELIFKMINAGAKRVEVISPAYQDIGDTEIAQISNLSIEYGGVENGD